MSFPLNTCGDQFELKTVPQTWFLPLELKGHEWIGTSIETYNQYHKIIDK